MKRGLAKKVFERAFVRDVPVNIGLCAARKPFEDLVKFGLTPAKVSAAIRARCSGVA